MKEIVIGICLVYSVVSLFVFWGIAHSQSKASKEAKTLVEKAAADGATKDNFDAGAVLENAAKLVEAFTKAGPAIASLGASIVALGFASYIVAQSPKDQDKTKTGTDNAASQGTNQPAKK